MISLGLIAGGNCKKTEQQGRLEPMRVNLPAPFVDVRESGLRLKPRVCIVAPGRNGKGHYHRIPADFQIIAVSKAVLVSNLRSEIWVMAHSDQPWFEQANQSFQGIRLFSYDAAIHSAALLQGTPNCYCFVPPNDSFLEIDVRPPLDGVIRYGATVSACAIQFAYYFGALEILLCGVDFSGDAYFDGTVNINANHGETWPAIKRLQPLLRHLVDSLGLSIATLSPSELDLPIYGA
jgi:hypothetical protein